MTHKHIWSFQKLAGGYWSNATLLPLCLGSWWALSRFWGWVSRTLVQDRTMLCQQGLARAGQVIKVFLLCDSMDSPCPLLLQPPCLYSLYLACA